MVNMDSLTQQVHQLCKSKSYVSKKTLKVLCVTFNVNAKVEYDMNTIFPFVTNRECNSYRPEIVIIGLQEIVELSATNVVGSKVLGDNETVVEIWRKSIETYLNKGITGIRNRNETGHHLIPYKSFLVNQMVGIGALMFVLETTVTSIRNVQLGIVTRGAFGNTLGNKGGVCIRFEIESSSICFIISHLTAHQENVSKRNEDYLAIITSKIFEEKCNGVLGDAYNINVTLPSSTTGKYSDPRLNALNKDLKNIQKRIAALDTKYSDTTSTSAAVNLQQQNATALNNVINSIVNNADISDITSAVASYSSSATYTTMPTYSSYNNSQGVPISPGTQLSSTHASTTNSGMASPQNCVAQQGAVGSAINATNVPSSSSNILTTATRLQLPTHEEVYVQSQLSPDDHDIIIWTGDLNYRIGEKSLEEVYEAIYNSETDINELKELYKCDQLYKEREAGNAFELFHEGEILFNPTYQYIPNEGIYDRREGKKNRIPAWCDRVLWRIGKGVEKMKSALMNIRSDGNTVLDILKSAFPSDIQFLRSETIQQLSAISNDDNKKSKGVGLLKILATRQQQQKDMQKEILKDRINNLNLSNSEIKEIRDIMADFYDAINIEEVKVLCYEACEYNKMSDHKPVKALLEIKVKRVDYGGRESALIEATQKYLAIPDVFDSERNLYLATPRLFPRFLVNCDSNTTADSSLKDKEDENSSQLQQQHMSSKRPMSLRKQPILLPQFSHNSTLRSSTVALHANHVSSSRNFITKIPSTTLPLAKSLILGPLCPLSVTPAYLKLKPTNASIIEDINITNFDREYVIDFAIWEQSLPKWFSITPLVGRLQPGETTCLRTKFLGISGDVASEPFMSDGSRWSELIPRKDHTSTIIDKEFSPHKDKNSIVNSESCVILQYVQACNSTNGKPCTSQIFTKIYNTMQSPDKTVSATEESLTPTLTASVTSASTQPEQTQPLTLSCQYQYDVDKVLILVVYETSTANITIPFQSRH